MQWNNKKFGEAWRETEVQRQQELLTSEQSTYIEPAQQLRLLEDHLTNTTTIVQQLLSGLPHMSGELGFAAGVAYQKGLTELYNIVKGWVGE